MFSIVQSFVPSSSNARYLKYKKGDRKYKVIENTITSDWIIKKYSQIPDLSFSPQIEAMFVFYQIFFNFYQIH